MSSPVTAYRFTVPATATDDEIRSVVERSFGKKPGAEIHVQGNLFSEELDVTLVPRAKRKKNG
jgi:hypothetical protein